MTVTNQARIAALEDRILKLDGLLREALPFVEDYYQPTRRLSVSTIRTQSLIDRIRIVTTPHPWVLTRPVDHD